LRKVFGTTKDRAGEDVGGKSREGKVGGEEKTELRMARGRRVRGKKNTP
jgi:hypothetical protein